MFGTEFFVAFGIGMMISAGTMMIYYRMGDDVRRAFARIKKGV